MLRVFTVDCRATQRPYLAHTYNRVAKRMKSGCLDSLFLNIECQVWYVFIRCGVVWSYDDYYVIQESHLIQVQVICMDAYDIRVAMKRCAHFI